MLLLGWLLGIAGGPISEYLRRTRRARDLGAALDTELAELRYTMASVVWSIRTRTGGLDRALIDWMDPIETSYDGPDRRPEQTEMWSRMKALPDQELSAANAARASKSSSAVALREYHAPFLEAHLGEVSLLPLKKQQILHQIRHQLDLFNQDVRFQQSQSALTFSSLDSENHERVKHNISECSVRLAERAQAIADAISGELNSA